MPFSLLGLKRAYRSKRRSLPSIKATNEMAAYLEANKSEIVKNAKAMGALQTTGDLKDALNECIALLNFYGER